MIISVNNRDFDIELATQEGQEKIKEFALTRNFEKVPFLNTLAVANTKIKDYSEREAISVEEIKDRINQTIAEQEVNSKSTNNLAFTAFNPLDSFFYIYVNYEKLDTDPRFNVEFISFLYLHQVCHNFFGHFTRPVINEYRERNKAITEIILDAQVNTFLMNALSYNYSSNGYIKMTKSLIEQEYPTYDKLYGLLTERYGIVKNFNTATEFPPVEKVLKDCEELFKDSNAIEALQQVGISMDVHSASEDLVQAVAQEMNQTVDELNTIQANSMEYLQEGAKQQGIGMSDAEKRQIESLFTKKSVLEVIKLTKTLKQASRIKFKKTWQTINRKRQYSEDIFMMGKKPTCKLHLVVGRMMPFTGEVR